MSLMSRIRTRHNDARNARAFNRAVRSAPTPAAREEILLIALRHTS